MLLASWPPMFMLLKALPRRCHDMRHDAVFAPPPHMIRRRCCYSYARCFAADAT